MEEENKESGVKLPSTPFLPLIFNEGEVKIWSDEEKKWIKFVEEDFFKLNS